MLLVGCSRRKAGLAAERVVKALARPFEIDGATITIGASVGAVFSEEGIDDLGQWLRQADGELYKAKAAGRGCRSIARAA
jgi:GGDEF domain-containing protein